MRPLLNRACRCRATNNTRSEHQQLLRIPAPALHTSRQSRNRLFSASQSWRADNNNNSSHKNSHNTNRKSRGSPSSGFWNAPRALLFSAFASSLAYAYGVSDAGNNIAELWGSTADRQPRYGTAKELEKVRHLTAIYLPPTIHN